MKKWTTGLAVLLLVQVGLIAWQWQPRESADFRAAQELLLSFAPEAIDEIRITAGKTDAEAPGSDTPASTDPLTLRRMEGQWQVSDYFDMRANAEKIETFLSDLQTLKAGWPVATTAASAKRFDVADDAYQRRIELVSQGQVVQTLYLGSSPGLRKVHARVAGTDDTHAVNFAVFNAPAQKRDWMDRGLLTLNTEDVTAVRTGGWRLERRGENWTLADLPSGKTTNQTVAGDWIRTLTGLEIDEVLGTEEKPEFQLADSAHNLEVTLKDGRTLTYRLAQPDESHAVLQRSDDPRFFRIAAYQLNDLLTLDLEALQQDAPAPDAPAADTPAASE